MITVNVLDGLLNLIANLKLFYNYTILFLDVYYPYPSIT